MNSTRMLTHTSDAYTLTAGNRIVHVTRLERTYRVTVTTASFGNSPVGDDDRSFASQPEADHYANALVECLTVTTVDVDQLVEQINAEVDASTAQTRAAQDALNADVTAIMAQSKGFRHLGHTVPTTGHTNSPTVAAKPLSPESETVLLAANNTVTKTLPRNQDCTLTQILALFNRGLCDPIRVRRGNRQEITGMRLTVKGQRHADQLISEVAA